MNNTRRKELRKILDSLEVIYDTLETISEEERESFENLPEGIQDSERGQLLEAYADAIEYAYGDLESVRDQLTNILEGQL
jgi:hypothetical protein